MIINDNEVFSIKEIVERIEEKVDRIEHRVSKIEGAINIMKWAAPVAVSVMGLILQFFGLLPF